MKTTTLLCALTLLGLTWFAGAGPAAAAAPAPLASVTTADFAWLAGIWVGEIDGELIEEHWSTPAGEVIMSMFRATTDGKVSPIAWTAMTGLSRSSRG